MHLGQMCSPLALPAPAPPVHLGVVASMPGVHPATAEGAPAGPARRRAPVAARPAEWLLALHPLPAGPGSRCSVEKPPCVSDGPAITWRATSHSTRLSRQIERPRRVNLLSSAVSLARRRLWARGEPELGEQLKLVAVDMLGDDHAVGEGQHRYRSGADRSAGCWEFAVGGWHRSGVGSGEG